MDAEDQRVRAELARDGLLFEGYQPRMEEVHRRNTALLKQIIEQHGWPGETLAGEDGAFAAWRIAQHSIGDPAFLRATLPLLWNAGRAGDVPLWQAAYLDDRIRMYEGRPQLYGSQFWPDEAGVLQPYEIADEQNLDRRRAEVGLEPFAARLEKMRAEASAEERHPPTNYQKFMEGYEDWLKKTGWR